MPRRQALVGSVGALAVMVTGAIGASTAEAASSVKTTATVRSDLLCIMTFSNNEVASNFTYSTSYRSGDDFYEQSVQHIQYRLGVTADGVYGPATAGAVKRLQASKGLVQDGVFGPKTAAAAGMHWGITRTYKQCINDN